MSAFENLKQRQAIVAPVKTNAFEELKKRQNLVSQPVEKEPGFVQSMAQSIASPFLKTVETSRSILGGIYNLGQAGINKLTGDKEAYQRNLQEAAQISSPTREADYGYLGKVKPVSKLKEAVGVGAEIGSWAVGGGAAKAGVQTLKQGILQGAKTGLKVGAGSGAIMGAGQTLQQEDAGIADVATGTLSGALAGGVGGGILGGVAGGILAPKVSKVDKIVKQRIDAINDIESNYSKLRKNAIASKDAFADTKQRVMSVDIGFPEAVDESGTLRTLNKGGVVDQYKKQTLDGTERIGRKTLEKEGAVVNPEIIRNQLKESILKSGLEEDSLNSALGKIDKRIEGLKLRADENGNIPLTKVHDAKIFTRNNVDYTNPSSKIEAKTISGAYQKVIENNSKTNIGEINKELTTYLRDLDFLESLDGRKVKGGKLGKYFATVAGNVVGAATGSVAGPFGSGIGSVIGGELASRIKGGAMSRTLAGETGKLAPKSKILQEAIKNIKTPKSPLLGLPEPKAGSPRSSIGSGQTINLPAKGQGILESARLARIQKQTQANAKAYSKSLGNRQEIYQPITSKNNITNIIPEKVNKPTTSLPQNTPKVKTEPLKYFAKETPANKIEEKIKVSRIREEELKNEIQDNEVALSEQFSKNPATPEHMENIMMELDISEAGKRTPIKNDYGQTEWIGQSSTFPQWIPEHLRDKKLFNQVMGDFSDLDNIKYPEANKLRQRALYDIIFDELDSRLGTNTNPIREKILKNYETINQGENPTSYNSGSRGSQSSTGSGITTTGGNGAPFTISMSESSMTGIKGNVNLTKTNLPKKYNKFTVEFLIKQIKEHQINKEDLRLNLKENNIIKAINPEYSFSKTGKWNGYGYENLGKHLKYKNFDDVLKELEKLPTQEKKTGLLKILSNSEKINRWEKKLSEMTGISLEDAKKIAQEKIDFEFSHIENSAMKNISGYKIPAWKRQADKAYSSLWEGEEFKSSKLLKPIKDNEHANAIVAASRRHNNSNYEDLLELGKEKKLMGEIDDVKEYARNNFTTIPEWFTNSMSKTSSTGIETKGILSKAKQTLAEKIKATGEQKPTIKLKRDVTVTTLTGEKVTIPEAEVLKAYESGGKAFLKDDREYIVSKSQYENIKNNSLKSEAKEFAPELKGTEESVRGGMKKQLEWTQEKNGDFNTSFNGKDISITPEGSKFYVYEKGGLLGKTVDSLADAKRNAQMYVDQSQAVTKYSQYQLPGGKNYKEVLIKAPENIPAGGFKVFNTKTNSFNILDKDGNILKSNVSSTFKSSHWDEPNVISHLRLNERTYQGKKWLFAEELQSDAARELRTIGKDAFIGKYGNDFYTKVVKWQELSVKRLLKEAVDGGYEGVSWTTGEQQAARYNLAKEIDTIGWTEYKGKYSITAEKNGKAIIDKDGLTGAELAEHIGKEPAQKIIDGVGFESTASTGMKMGELANQDLKIGGEWAKNLYDKQVKNIVEDITGGKVEVIDMGLPIEKKAGMGDFRLVSYAKEQPMGRSPLLTEKNMKIRQEISTSIEYKPYIITDILGEKGKFKAVPKKIWEEKAHIGKVAFESHKETFDISTKLSSGQQAIRLTPEIKAMVKGSSPILGLPNKKQPILGLPK